MKPADDLDIFLACPPGLEVALRGEAKALGFRRLRAEAGGVSLRGKWPDVWRANLMLRGASRVLVRIGSFKATHLAELDHLAREFPWGDVLNPDVPLRIETTCRKSRIYHSDAATERVEKAIRLTLGAEITEDAPLRLLVRLDHDICTFSLDTSGELLHRRGFKRAVAKAPLRETMAALLLHQCGYTGAEPVLDPMCGSGTFPIEAAEIAAGLAPGRERGFAFEQLETFDAEAWMTMREAAEIATPQSPHLFYGFDRDAGAIKASIANAERAGLAELTRFAARPISDLEPPEGPPGLVIVNPPYGERIGEPAALRSLYGSMGRVLAERFKGWRVGLVTSDRNLAHATRLPFHDPGPPIPHGPLRIQLFRSGVLR